MVHEDTTKTRQEMAHQLDKEGTILLGSPTDRAFEIGKIFNEINENKLFKELGYSTFEEYIKVKKVKRSTIRTNMLVASKFDVHAHGHIKISKLRLLASLESPSKAIEAGLMVLDSEGTLTLKMIQELTYRELQAALKDRKMPLSTPLHQDLQGAVASIIPKVTFMESHQEEETTATGQETGHNLPTESNADDSPTEEGDSTDAQHVIEVPLAEIAADTGADDTESAEVPPVQEDLEAGTDFKGQMSFFTDTLPASAESKAKLMEDLEDATGPILAEEIAS